MTKIQKLRAQAFSRQDGRCHYCKVRMWLLSPEELGLTVNRAAKLKCTAEHLQALRDGGQDQPDNIVAACLRCNEMRHRMHPAPDPVRWRQHVQRLQRAKQWHKHYILAAGLMPASAVSHPR